MKAAVLTAIRQIEMRDVPNPEIQGDRDVLLRMNCIGVCGSDVHYYETGRIGSQVVEYPFIVGHEGAATVAEIGKQVRRVKVGDTVAIDPAVVCYQCDQCRQGRENTCRKLKFLGCPGQLEGCLCEYIVMPEDCLYPLKGQITLEQAVLSEPLAIGVYAVQQARLASSADIGILGSGPIGLSVLLAARGQGIRKAYVTDKIGHRVELARKAQAAWAGNPDRQDIVHDILIQQPAGLDAVFECAGDQDAIDQGIELLKPGGKMLLIGIPRVDRVSFPIDKIRRKELTLINVRRQNHCVQPTIDLIASATVDADIMVTHRFAFEQTQEAFELVGRYGDGVVKALINL